MTVTVSLRQNQSTSLSWAQVDNNFIELATAVNATAQGGTTAQRPVVPVLFQSYFDTTLGIPITCSQITPSIIWVNGAGFPV